MTLEDLALELITKASEPLAQTLYRDLALCTGVSALSVCHDMFNLKHIVCSIDWLSPDKFFVASTLRALQEDPARPDPTPTAGLLAATTFYVFRSRIANRFAPHNEYWMQLLAAIDGDVEPIREALSELRNSNENHMTKTGSRHQVMPLLVTPYNGKLSSTGSLGGADDVDYRRDHADNPAAQGTLQQILNHSKYLDDCKSAAELHAVLLGNVHGMNKVLRDNVVRLLDGLLFKRQTPGPPYAGRIPSESTSSRRN